MVGVVVTVEGVVVVIDTSVAVEKAVDSAVEDVDVIDVAAVIQVDASVTTVSLVDGRDEVIFGVAAAVAVVVTVGTVVAVAIDTGVDTVVVEGNDTYNASVSAIVDGAVVCVVVIADDIDNDTSAVASVTVARDIGVGSGEVSVVVSLVMTADDVVVTGAVVDVVETSVTEEDILGIVFDVGAVIEIVVGIFRPAVVAVEALVVVS